MRYFILLGCFFLTALFNKVQSQTVIDFTTNPTATGPNTWDPSYWTRGGCGGSQKWGPNPLPVSGYNVRLVGASYRYALPPATALYLRAGRNGIDPVIENHKDFNAILSLEYPFASNKTYLVEFVGIKEEGYWGGGGTRPNRYKKAVFWIKLDDNPEISTPVQNKCGYELHPVEKSVGRYSKLIADPSMAFEDKTYTVKFSLKENKSALKIIFDPSPADPNLSFDSKFGLRTIKITEMPYEEYAWEDVKYTNVPTPPRGTPGYEIYNPRPGDIPVPIKPDFSVDPNSWYLNSNGIDYSLNLRTLLPAFDSSILKDIMLIPPDGRRGPTPPISLPLGYKEINLSYEFTNDNNVIITYHNLAATPLIETLNFKLVFK